MIPGDQQQQDNVLNNKKDLIDILSQKVSDIIGPYDDDKDSPSTRGL